MWFEIWQQFGKHTICDLRQASSSGKIINVVAGLSAQKRSMYYFLLCIANRGKCKGVRLRTREHL